MPTYQYACTSCGHRFEAVQSFSDASLGECPECSGKLRKLFGSVGVVFKGSGFYRNDSRAESTSKAEKAEKSEPKKESTPKSGDSSTTTSSSTPTTSSTTSSTPSKTPSKGSSSSAAAAS